MRIFIIQILFCSRCGYRKRERAAVIGSVRESIYGPASPERTWWAVSSFRFRSVLAVGEAGLYYKACLRRLPACLRCLPAGRGRRRGRSGRGRACRAMQMSDGDGQLCFPMSLRKSSAPSLNSSLQTLYFPQNTGSQALGELAGWLGELHMQNPLFWFRRLASLSLSLSPSVSLPFSLCFAFY